MQGIAWMADRTRTRQTDFGTLVDFLVQQTHSMRNPERLNEAHSATVYGNASLYLPVGKPWGMGYLSHLGTICAIGSSRTIEVKAGMMIFRNIFSLFTNFDSLFLVLDTLEMIELT